MPLPVKWENHTRITLDYETYYSDDYTLRKLNTSTYIRDERFRAHMVTVRVNGGTTELVLHKDIPKYLKALRRKHKKIMLVAHNMPFDGLISSHHFGFVPDVFVCTLAMARMLHGKEIKADLDTVATKYKRGNKMPNVLAAAKNIENLELPEHQNLLVKMCAYGMKDTEMCDDIFLDMLPHISADEMEIMHYINQMFCDPVLKLNTQLATEARDEEVLRRAELLKRVILPEEIESVRAGTLLPSMSKKDRATLTNYQISQKLLRNNDFFERVLNEYGVAAPKKWSAAKEKSVVSFSKDLLVDIQNSIQMDAEDADDLWSLLQGRIDANSTITVSRAERLLELGKNGWAMPVGYHYGKTTTNRLSGANKTNFQNFGRGSKLRRAIEAAMNKVLAVMDSSQIEARCLAWLAGAKWKLKMFSQYDVITGAIFYLKMDMKKPKKERRTKIVKFKEGGDWYTFISSALCDPTFIEFERAGPDAYRVAAAGIYGVDISLVTKDERQIGKVSELALGYQGSVGAFNSMARNYGVKLPENVVKGIVNKWRRVNKEVVQFWADCETALEALCSNKRKVHRFGPDDCLKCYWKGKVAHIEIPGGFTIKYPGLECVMEEKWGKMRPSYKYHTVEGEKHVYGGLVCENITQAIARQAVFEQCLVLAREERWVLSTHDEGVFMVDAIKAPQFMRRAVELFFTSPKWAPDLPVAGDGGYAVEYSK